MIPALAEPRARFTFVVGKGGVGKSTVSAGLALAWSAHRPIHLISTDPAHSLGDVFDLQFAPGTANTACVPTLTVEEPDAAARAAQWLARVRDPLTELLERGSYLDRAAIDHFTSLSLPGIDEIMAGLRLVELARAPQQRTVVVDTAPTGHTLRLLDAHQVLESWHAVMDALAAKADAVAGALMRGRVRSAGAELRAELADELAILRDDVIARADYIVVTRAGGVVAAETERLTAELRARGLRLRSTIHVGTAAGADVTVVPWMSPAPRGCDGLRAWIDSVGRNEAAQTVEESARADGGAGVAWLKANAARLLIVAGKGGVGKSTCAAAAALALAEQGPVLLMSSDPAGSLGDVLEAPVDAVPRPVAPGVRAVQIDAAAAVARWRAQLLGSAEPLLERIGLGGEPALDRRVLETLWELAPAGMDELVALVELMDAVETGETVVLDTAPTGHLLRLLALPASAQEWTRMAMRILLEYRMAGELDSLTASVIAFSKQLKDFRARLADAGWTGALVVTTQGPVVEAETQRLVTSLAQAGISVSAILTNRHDPRSAAVGSAGQVRLSAPASRSPLRGVTALQRFTAQWELL